MDVEIAVGHHVGAIGLTAVAVAVQGVHQWVHISAAVERALHQGRADDVFSIHVVVVSVGRAELQVGGRSLLVGRAFRPVVCELEDHAAAYPLAYHVVDVGAQPLGMNLLVSLFVIWVQV